MNEIDTEDTTSHPSPEVQYHVHDTIWSPVDIVDYCKKRQSEILRDQELNWENADVYG